MRVPILAAIVLAAGWSAGCRERPPTEGDQPPASQGGETAPDGLVEGAEGVNAYTVRGVVMDLPREDAPISDFVIMHEEIPDFVRNDGERGMGSMQMPFAEPDEGLEGVEIGDKVEFRWLVRWEGRMPRDRTTDLRILPDDTELDLPAVEGGDGATGDEPGEG